MKMYTMYKVKIKHYNHIFKDTIAVYRNAVDFLIGVCNENWSEISVIEGSLNQKRYVETLIHKTDIVNIGLHFILKNVRPYAASCSEA